jgi:hypothetical protein
LRSTTTVVYCAIDNLVSTTNKALTGFAEFLEGLGEANIPFVPVTTRSRLQFDATIRKFGLGHPFLAEGGCGVFLPEDYFHLKPPRSMRLGRFTCVPMASARALPERRIAAARGGTPPATRFRRALFLCRCVGGGHPAIPAGSGKEEGTVAPARSAVVAGSRREPCLLCPGPFTALPALIPGPSIQHWSRHLGRSCGTLLGLRSLPVAGRARHRSG